MKYFSLFFALLSFLFAREDPFIPLFVPKDSIRPYYGETSVFQNANIELPSSARLIKKVEITFQNIDGSIETKSVLLSGRIDWKMPLVLSQGSLQTTQNTKQSTLPNQDIKIPKNAPYVITDDNVIFIAYEGKLKRHFIMQNPYKIVFDFEINKDYFKHDSIAINKPYFKSLRFGLHTHFLRIVLELDGSYVYEIKEKKKGILVNVK